MRRLGPGLWGLVAALYLLAFPYHPGLRSPNELCRLWQTRSLVEYGKLEINDALRDFGYVGDLSKKDGKYYPSKAPLLSFLAVPGYVALKAIGGGGLHAVPELALVYFSRLLLTVLPTLLCLVWIRRFLAAYVQPLWADLITVTYALGSLAFSYSLLFMSHQLVAVLLFCAFYALWRVLRGEWRKPALLLSGAFAGAAVAAEYTAALGLLGLGLYGLAAIARSEGGVGERVKRLAQLTGLSFLGALPFLVFLGAYHQAAFGNPLHTGYLYLNDAAYQPWHLGGFLGIRYPDPHAFALSFVSPLRGLFALAPFWLVSLLGLGLLWRRDRAVFAASAGLLLAYAYFTSSFSYASWGWTTGPRHMTSLMPFVLLPAALVVERLSSASSTATRLGLGFCGGLAASSMLVTGALSLVDYVPDSVSSAFFGLALPLFRDGYTPPSLLGALGIQSPAAGAVLLVLLGLVAILIGALLANGTAPALMAATAALALHLGVLALATRNDPSDQAAVQHLKSVWLAPPGKSFSLWPKG